jgi:hypothetical protein
MKRTTTVALMLALALAGACGNDRSDAVATDQPVAAAPPAGSVTLTPEQLGALGAQIRKEPARAEELLTQRGLTPQSFEQQIRQVTESPDASKRYAEAYRKASA